MLDLIIVGAGMTGLKAARDCVKKGLTVQVLEGRDRVGGRACSVAQSWKGQTAWFDFGAHFIGDEPFQDSIWKLARELNLEPFKQYAGPETPPGPGDPFWCGQGANLQENAKGGFDAYIGTTVPDAPGDQFYLQMMQSMVDQIPTDAPWSVPTAAALDALSVEDWVKTVNIPEVGPPSDYFMGLVAMLCRVGFSCEPREISMLWLLFYIGSSGGLARFQAIRWPLQGAQGFRLPKGAQSLAERMAAELPSGTVTTGVTITACDNPAGGPVKLHDANGKTYQARKVLFAMAPALYADVAFSPALPQPRTDAAAAMHNSDMIMTFVRFDTAFWRTDTSTYTGGTVNGIPVYPGNPDPMFDGNISAWGLSGDVLMLDGPSVWMMDNTSKMDDSGADGAPAMFAFIVGDQARQLRKQTPAEREAAILKRMGEALQTDLTPHNPQYFEMDWNAEGLSKGCPAGHFGKDSFLEGGPAILLEGEGRKPVGNLFFASTETASISNGYMDGAVWSGTQIAFAIQADLENEAPTLQDDFLRRGAMEFCIKSVLAAFAAGNPFMAKAVLDPRCAIHAPGGKALSGTFKGPMGAVDFFTELGVLMTLETVNLESVAVDLDSNRGFAWCNLTGVANLTKRPFRDLKMTVMMQFTDPAQPEVRVAEQWMIADSALIDALVLPGMGSSKASIEDMLGCAPADGLEWLEQVAGPASLIVYGPGGTAVPEGPWLGSEGFAALLRAFAAVPDFEAKFEAAASDSAGLTGLLRYRITGRSTTSGTPFDQPLLMTLRLGNAPGNPLSEIRLQTDGTALV